MAKSLLVGGGLLLSVAVGLAQNYNMAVQQARRDSAQNDAEQQRIAGAANGGASAAGGAAAPAAPMDPALKATLKNVNDLQTDLAALVADTDKPATEQKNALLSDLSAAAQGTKTSVDSVKKLADDLIAATTSKTKLTAAQRTKLAREVHALFNSAHLNETQQQKLLDDVQKTLTEAGAALDAAVDVATDLKVVVAQTK